VQVGLAIAAKARQEPHAGAGMTWADSGRRKKYWWTAAPSQKILTGYLHATIDYKTL